jgi:hypothetical protein
MLRRVRQNVKAESWQGVLPAMALLAGSLLLVLAMHLRLPKAGEQVAVVFPPGTSLVAAATALSAANARLVRPGGIDSIIVAEFAQDMSFAELIQRGMWFALDPEAIGGCLVSNAPALHSSAIRIERAAS